MKWTRRALLLCCLFFACSLERAGAGDPCRRSIECVPGLACVEGACSRELAPIAEQSTVPELGETDAAAADAAARASDASAPAADGG